MIKERFEDLSEALRRRVDWEKVGGWLTALAIIGGVAWYYLRQHLTQVKEKRTAEIRQKQTDASISALALKYNAVTNWAASLPERGLGEHFSIDVSRALIQADGRPVLLEMALQDIAEHGDTYVARFSQFRRLQLFLELKCSKEQATNLLQAQGTVSTPCALIARISEVSRPRFEVSGTVEGGDEDSGPLTGLELNYSPSVFHAKGVCVDLVRTRESK